MNVPARGKKNAQLMMVEIGQLINITGPNFVLILVY